MDRLSILNHLAQKNGYSSYLEIGVFTGYTLDNVVCKKKIGIDPFPDHYKGTNEVFRGTSDEYFSQLDEATKFDMCFVDGMHLAEYVARDISNCIKHLNENGTIVLHDMSPPTPDHAARHIILPDWNGDCYKAILSYGSATPFQYYTIDTDWGVGILKPLRQPPEESNMCAAIVDFRDLDYMKAQEDWDYFDKNRRELLNIISVEEFLKREAIHETA